MPITLQEIKNNALAFVQKWENETSEDAEAKSFWDDFFEIFGISRYRLASFEKPVKKQDGRQGYIDLLWKGELLVEHKSRGKNLDRAYRQATDYFIGLKDYELPKYVLVTDFANFRLYDLQNEQEYQFLLQDLVKNIHLFAFMAGYQPRTYKDTDEINIKTAELLGKLHEQLADAEMDSYELDMCLVRLVFCMFADDTGIFEKNIFWEYIDKFTEQNNHQILMHILAIFETLNTPYEKRGKRLEIPLAQFPYVNGNLFAEKLSYKTLQPEARKIILDICALDWGTISPAIFGSMFQAAMNPNERRNLGAHYTSEGNIQKVIRPLFLDDLYAEFDKIKHNVGLLQEFHEKLASLLFLDPACGCGNFLIITYRELRELELLVLKELYKDTEAIENIDSILKVSLLQFYGIEIDDFAGQIAQLAMWLTEHQMNIKFSQTFGKYYARIPLKDSAKIICTNSLEIDWDELLIEPKPVVEKKKIDIFPKGKRKPVKNFHTLFEPQPEPEPIIVEKPKQYNYILGNPPFVGHHLQNEAQKKQLNTILHDIKSSGVMDYVSAWFYKASAYIQNTKIKCAFVSTNSITQGEQASILWGVLFQKYKIKIHFAHRTFAWKNEAKGNAAVHCVIVGFGNFDLPTKRLFEYENSKGEPHELKVTNINPYLAPTNDLIVPNRRKPICAVPEMMYGSKPTDDGNFLFTDEEKEAFLAKEPQASSFIKPFISAKEFLNGQKRWCLWLVGIAPDAYRKLPEVMKRIEAVKNFRAKSIAETTRNYPNHALFRQVTQPDSDYIVVPRTTSENRKYIPMGFFSKTDIVSDTCQAIPNGDLYLFGLLTSVMHMTWVKYVCGRLKSDFRYSKDVVYNNFPFPLVPTEAQKKKVESGAKAVLEARALYPNSSLADLYDTLTMPAELIKAHNGLDKAVDACYSKVSFGTELERIEFLFQQYEAIVASLFVGDEAIIEDEDNA